MQVLFCLLGIFPYVNARTIFFFIFFFNYLYLSMSISINYNLTLRKPIQRQDLWEKVHLILPFTVEAHLSLDIITNVLVAWWVGCMSLFLLMARSN